MAAGSQRNKEAFGRVFVDTSKGLGMKESLRAPMGDILRLQLSPSPLCVESSAPQQTRARERGHPWVHRPVYRYHQGLRWVWTMMPN